MNTFSKQRILSWIILSASIMLPSATFAANHIVSRTTTAFDGSGVRPGDTVTLEAGVRGPLRIRDLHGTADRPIVIKNDTSANTKVTIRNPTAQRGGLVFNCNSCTHVILDGTGKWVGAPADAYCGAPNGTTGCGIKVTSTVVGDSPSIYLMFGGLSSNFTVKGVEVDGNWPAVSRQGSGMRVSTNEVSGSDYPDMWRENIVFEQNFVHRVYLEGFYIGPNWTVDQLRLRNVSIRDNLVKSTGWEGIQMKSAIEGTNSISGNVVINAGSRVDTTAGAHHGIQPFESACDVFDNLVIGSGESGIALRTQHLPESYGPLKVKVYNNVIVGGGETGPLKANGISVGHSSGAARYAAKVFNNTVISAPADGISVGGIGSEQLVANNVVVDAGEKSVSAPSGARLIANREGTLSALRFVDPAQMDFRLAADSPARDAASLSHAPAMDFHGAPRPQGTSADQGAFEYLADAIAAPKPPILQ